MKDLFGSRKRRNAQTLVFFMVAFGAIIMLCGLAIDSGVLYLSKARLSRAVDGAALAAVGNFHRSDDPATNRTAVALIMRNFAVANFTDLGKGPNGGIASIVPAPIQTPYTLPTGVTAYKYTYNFNDGSQDANTQFKRFVKVTLSTGSGGAITSAVCEARCPVNTYFIGFAGSFFRDLKVSSSAIATRNPRLIMIVIDRSASMLQPGGGAFHLAPAVVQFLNFFDTSSDNIGIVSFGSNARLEMPLTTNFLIAATNNLVDSYELNTTSGSAEPGRDPESLDANYDTEGVRRLKFGGQTAADDGIRLGMEQLMNNGGFNDPDVVKYMVIFTDGKWNVCRTLFTAPGYVNSVKYPTLVQQTSPSSNVVNLGTWSFSTNMALNQNIFPVPTLSPMPGVTNAIMEADINGGDFTPLVTDHLNDTWQSADNSGFEPLQSPGPSSPNAYGQYDTTTLLGQYNGTNYYTPNVDVWLQPGSVAYVRHPAGSGGSIIGTYVSNFNNPTQHVQITLAQGDGVELHVPGYVVDGLAYDGIDLPYSYPTGASYPVFRGNNYQEQYMWPDDTQDVNSNPFLSTSAMRQLLFRNYANLLTGYNIYRPDDPIGSGFEHTITEQNPTGAPRPRYGLGAYYPASPFYWPFDLVGVDWDPTYALTNANVDPDPNQIGITRHATYSINMQSTAAAPAWAGEWFYKSISGSGPNNVSGTGTTSASVQMTAADWQVNVPQWVTDDFAPTSLGLMTNESAHNTNMSPAPSVWRPMTFNGSNTPVASGLAGCTPANTQTGGFVTDGLGHYYANSMAWSGRPTHYYDFSQSKWVSIPNNHSKNTNFLQLGNWKAYEYCWHARAMGVTIYTVGFGIKVSPDQQSLLAQLANSTNTTAGNVQTWDGSEITSYTPGIGTAITYNASQPIGQQFFGTNATDISNDFYQVGQAINAALTQ